MLTMIIHWLVTALVLLLIANILPGFSVDNFTIALIAALVLGLVNLFIRPLVLLFTLPLNILTLGLFAFVVNALLLWLTAGLVDGFEISNFLSALVGALLLALVTGFIGSLGDKTHRAI